VIGAVIVFVIRRCKLTLLLADLQSLYYLGELMGAHHHIGKGKFYRESVKVPWSFSLPGVIPVGVIPEDVSHLDSVATFLDYLNVSQFDVSDGTSLRRYLDYQGINDQREECAVISEMDERRPLDRREFTRMNLGREPEFMIVHRGFKLMLPKVATSPIRDMLFNLKRDPYEMKNLLGSRETERAFILLVELST